MSVFKRGLASIGILFFNLYFFLLCMKEMYSVKVFPGMLKFIICVVLLRNESVNNNTRQCQWNNYCSCWYILELNYISKKCSGLPGIG